MARLSDLVVAIGGNTKNLDKELGKAMRKMRNFGKSTKQLGKSLSMNVTAPIAALGFTAVRAFQQQAKAIAQVEAGLQSTAGQVGYTSQELQRMASDLQKTTLFGDEQILQDATSQLLTFTNISGEQFERTQKAALDLATRLDGDLKSASIQLGKALNDPVANLSALSRSGIQFSTEQKEVIKSLTETGRLAEAQTIILDELNKQYGGSAEAAAKADGGFTQLANAFGDLQEQFGKILVDVLRPVVDFLRDFIGSLQNASPQLKQMAVTISLVAAAIGPLLVLLPSLVQGFMLMLSPASLIIAALIAIVAAVYKFSSEVSKPIASVINYFIDLYNEVTFVRAIIGALKGVVQTVFDFFGFAINSVIGAFKDLGAIISAIFEGNFSAIPGLVSDAFENAANRAIEFGKKAGENIAEGINNELERDPIELVTPESVQNAIDTMGGLKTYIDGLMSGGGAPPATGAQAITPMTATTGATETGPRGLVGMAEMQDRLTQSTKQYNAALQESVEIDKELETRMQSLVNIGNQLGDSFGMAFESIANGAASAKEAMKQMARDTINMALNAAQAHAIEAALNSGKFTGPAAPVVIPALIGALTGLVRGAFGQLTAFADGGIVSGPTAALVGEYAGARTNPEVIAPLDKLQAMIQGAGGGNVTVTGRLSGRDILLSSERSNFERNRVRGF